ncbi:hypothetical protein pb186bvf_014039 [Paramecium bursaria]
MQSALRQVLKEEQNLICFKMTNDEQSFKRCTLQFQKAQGISNKEFVNYVRNRKI